MTDEMPASIQAILDAESAAALQQPRVIHRVDFNWDGVALSTFESDMPIHVPAARDIVSIYETEVEVKEVSVGYSVDEGTQIITATVEVVPLAEH